MALTGNAMPENVLIVTDSRGSLLERRIVSEIAYRVALTDIGWSNLFTSVISKNNAAELVQVSHDSMQDDLAKMLFMEKLDEARPYLDTGRIIEYSLKMDPELNRALTKGAAVDDALWGAYSRSMQGNSWEGSLNYFGVLVDEASRMGYPNVIEVLFHHKVIAAEFGEPGDVPYHLIGRGFVAEGARWPLLDKHGNKTGSTAITIPAGLVPEEVRVAYAIALVEHEIVGHTKLRLRDHPFDKVNPMDCIMSIPQSREQFVELVRQNRGVMLCGGCKAMAGVYS
ncbi:TPA: hypothetical protein HA231_01250 [Candidatus Woesearchaeota archaeon]|nr:hypothetical protein [Candidatus Woesearchaeota archaeon]